MGWGLKNGADGWPSEGLGEGEGTGLGGEGEGDGAGEGEEVLMGEGDLMGEGVLAGEGLLVGEGLLGEGLLVGEGDGLGDGLGGGLGTIQTIPGAQGWALAVGAPGAQVAAAAASPRTRATNVAFENLDPDCSISAILFPLDAAKATRSDPEDG